MRADTRSRAALGALKETIGAVGHLDEMLRSPRVAAGAIAAVLPDVIATLPSLQSELDLALEEQRERFEIEALFAFIRENLSTLSDCIEKASARGRNLRATSRLELERALSSLEQHLLGALPLFELMVESAEVPAGPVDVQELLLLLREGDQSHGLRGNSVNVGIEVEGAPVWLLASPRTALTLISLTASLLGDAVTARGLTIRVTTHALEAASARAELAVIARPPQAAMSKFVIPPSIAPSEACLANIALVLGVELSRENDQLTLRWQPPAVAT